MLSKRVTETVTAALKGENKAPTSVRGWQERPRLVGEGVREEAEGGSGERSKSCPKGALWSSEALLQVSA